MNEPLPLIIERADGAYFTGDLDAAKALLRNEYGEHLRVTGVDQGDGAIGYLVGEYRGSDLGAVVKDPDVHAANQWGVGTTEDEAWRYLAGADFGPVDEEYSEEHLRQALLAALLPDVLGPVDLEDLRRDMEDQIEGVKTEVERLTDMAD